MGRRGGDTFEGPVQPFDVPARQRTLTPAQDTWGGQTLYMLRLICGLEPPDSKWGGVKISELGRSTDPAQPGTSGSSSLFGYIKQIEIDLADVRSQLTTIAATQQQLLALETQAQANTTIIIGLLQSIDSKLP